MKTGDRIQETEFRSQNSGVRSNGGWDSNLHGVRAQGRCKSSQKKETENPVFLRIFSCPPQLLTPEFCLLNSVSDFRLRMG